jgi:hypothetical protein
MSDFVNGSSKPKQEESLESRIKKQINHQKKFMSGSKELEVTKISSLTITSVQEGKYLDQFKNKWNLEYYGNARISVKTGDDISSDLHDIRGFANIFDNNDIIISDLINVL